jgi:protein arginine kinase
MSWNKVVSQPLSNWMHAGGAYSHIVISSRVRLARNLSGYPFPQRMTPAQAEQVIGEVAAGVREINLMGLPSRVDLVRLAEVPGVDRQVLVEKHLISPLQAKESPGRALALSEDESVSIMINEEDHLRIQCLFPGLNLTEAWRLANQVDDALEQRLNYAFHHEKGYLTTCPTNLGTGMRASVMVHLPALVMLGQVGPLFSGLSKLGLVVRGLYGEGTEASGNLFQISNQISLGQTEEEIVQNLTLVAERVVQQEEAARQILARDRIDELRDRVGRARGILSGAHMISSEEAMKLLSDMRLGVDLGILPRVEPRFLNELLVCIRPAFLQKRAGRELSTRERDILRAELIRHRLGAGS